MIAANMYTYCYWGPCTCVLLSFRYVGRPISVAIIMLNTGQRVYIYVLLRIHSCDHERTCQTHPPVKLVPHICNILQSLSLAVMQRRCSGDDAVNIAGSAQPLFRGCKLQAKRCGVRAFENGGGRLIGCRIEGCSEQGIKAMEQSHITLER